MAGVFKHMGGSAWNAVKGNKGVQYLAGDVYPASMKSRNADIKKAGDVASTTKKQLAHQDKRRKALEAELAKDGISDDRKTRINEMLGAMDARKTNKDASIDAANKQIAENIVGYGKDAAGWMMGADKKGAGGGRAMAIGARWGTVAAGSMAVGTGIRMVNGGGLTYNNQGERDIAGIPLI